MKLNDESLGKARELFKGLDISQKGAQSLVDFYVSEMQRVTDAVTAAQEDLVREVAEEGRKQIMADPEIGPRAKQVKADIAKAYDAIANMVPEKAAERRATIDSFKQLMDNTGVGNALPFVKVLKWVADLVNEGTHVAGGAPSIHGQARNGQGNANPGLAQSMYPSNPQS